MQIPVQPAIVRESNRKTVARLHGLQIFSSLMPASQATDSYAKQFAGPLASLNEHPQFSFAILVFVLLPSPVSAANSFLLTPGQP